MKKMVAVLFVVMFFLTACAATQQSTYTGKETSPFISERLVSGPSFPKMGQSGQTVFDYWHTKVLKQVTVTNPNQFSVDFKVKCDTAMDLFEYTTLTVPAKTQTVFFIETTMEYVHDKQCEFSN